MGDGLMEVIRFVDEKDLVRIGVREQGETNARLIPVDALAELFTCLLYTSPSPRDRQKSRMPSSA